MPLLKNRREKILATLLGLVLAVLGIAFGGRALFDIRKSLETKIAQAEGEELEAEGWIGEEEYWRSRGAWLAVKQPKMEESRREGLELLQKIEVAARSHSVEVTGRTIKDAVTTPEFSGTPVRVEVAGAFSDIFTWLHELQQPGNFVLINEMTIKASNKPDLVDCSVELMHCYQPVTEDKGS